MPPMQAQLAVRLLLLCSTDAIANLSDIKEPVSLETGSFYLKPGSYSQGCDGRYRCPAIATLVHPCTSYAGFAGAKTDHFVQVGHIGKL